MPLLFSHKYQFNYIVTNKVSIKVSENFNCNSLKLLMQFPVNLFVKANLVGETSNLIKQQMNGHRSGIKHNRQ